MGRPRKVLPVTERKARLAEPSTKSRQLRWLRCPCLQLDHWIYGIALAPVVTMVDVHARTNKTFKVYVEIQKRSFAKMSNYNLFVMGKKIRRTSNTRSIMFDIGEEQLVKYRREMGLEFA